MIKPISILACTMFLSGCATLFAESTDTVRFESEQTGIEAYIEGGKVGDVPFSITLER